MTRSKWIAIPPENRPRYLGDAEAWYRYPTVSEQDRAPIGKKRLQKLRGRDFEARSAGTREFAQKLAEFLPPAAWLAYMPSSTRRSHADDGYSTEAMVLAALNTSRPDVTIIEPLVRAAPVPREHEDGIREVSLLRSTLEPVPVVISAHVLYVADDMVQTGAAFAAFSTALADRWPGVRPVLLALVFSPRHDRWA